MLRRSSCGNMALTWVICAGSTPRFARDELLLLLPLGEEGGGLLRYQRMAKKPTSATARSCGMLIDVSVWAMVAVFVELVAGRGGWVFARRRSPRVVCSRVAGG